MSRTPACLLTVAILLMSALGGCNPMNLSSECKAQVSDCLKDCPEPPYRQLNPADNDQRTECETRCQGICTE